MRIVFLDLPQNLTLPINYRRINSNSKVLQEKRHKDWVLENQTKVREVRQNCRKVTGEGQRSGSRKLVWDNWHLLKNRWGGSPATVTISSSRLSFNMEHIDEEEVEEGEEGKILGNNNNNDETQYDDSISLMIDKTIKMHLSQKPFVIMRKILQNSLTTNAKCF